MRQVEKKKPATTQGEVVGKVQLLEIDSVKPNAWNPNGMSDFQAASLKEGLQATGWLASQSLLVWGRD